MPVQLAFNLPLTPGRSKNLLPGHQAPGLLPQNISRGVPKGQELVPYIGRQYVPDWIFGGPLKQGELALAGMSTGGKASGKVTNYFKARSELRQTLGTGLQRFMGGWGIKKRSALGLAYGGGLILGGALMASHVIKSLWSTSKRNSRVSSSMQGSGMGPGYITWSKKGGMPANHLSTRGLTNALSRARHTSII